MSHDRDKPEPPVTSKLVDAVRQMRIASADRGDVVVEMREATRTRLELLAEDLHSVIEDVPADDDRFDFALTSGLQPRFWIDATTHVAMGPDRRTYRFVRDTRLGRVVLAESDDRLQIVDRIVTYIALRIHERELVLAGDVTSYRDMATGRSTDRGYAEERRVAEQRPLDRISEALATMREENARHRPSRPQEPADERLSVRESEDQPTAARRARRDAQQAAAPAAPAKSEPSVMGQAQSVVNAVAWILLGVVIGAGALLLAFQNVFVQR